MSQSQPQPVYEEVVGGYKPGSITRIKLMNFLTYHQVEFKPGPRLNIVMGPNGTGKSTILNAICLGLGGEPKVLGRADDVRQFVTHGEQRALVEIELQPPPGQTKPDIFRREIDVQQGSQRGNGRGASVFSINGEKVNIKQIQQRVQDVYNIAIDNLCTFLPQDRVGNFSGFQSKQLLEETEKSLSASRQLYDTHQELIRMEIEYRQGGNNTNTLEQNLAQKKTELATLEREKQRMEERQECVDLVELIKKKILWLRYDEGRDEYTHLKEDKDKFKAEFDEKAKAIAPLEETHTYLSGRLNQLETRNKTYENRTKRATDELEKQKQKFTSHEDSIMHVTSNLLALDTEAKAARRAVNEAKQRYEEGKSKFEELCQGKTIEDFEQQRRECNADFVRAKGPLQAFKSSLTKVNKSLREKQEDFRDAEARLQRMNDERALRRKAVFQRDRNLEQITQWIEANKKDFRRKVWGPIVLEITVNDKRAASYLENAIPRHTLKTFVVECKEDYDTIYQAIRRKLRLPINLLTVERGILKPVTRPYSQRKYEMLKAEHGVQGYLDETFTAPDPVLQAIRNAAAVHKVLVGGSATQASMDRGLGEMLSAPEGSQSGQRSYHIFTSKGQQAFKYANTISRYSGKGSLSVDQVSNAQWLQPGIDPDRKREAQERVDRLQQEMNKFQQEIERINQDSEQAHKDHDEAKALYVQINNDIKALMKRDAAVKRLERKYHDAQAAAMEDNSDKKRQYLKNLMNHIKGSVSSLDSHLKAHGSFLDTTYKSAGTRIVLDAINRKELKARTDVEDAKKAFQEIQTQYRKKKARVDQLKKQVKAYFAEAQSKAPMTDENGEDTPIKKKMDDLENCENVQMAQGALDDALERARSIEANPAAIHQYETVKQEVEGLEDQLKNMETVKAAKQQEIKDKAKEWETSLTRATEKINVKFGEYMRELGCAGQVVLKRGNTAANSTNNHRIQTADLGMVGNFADWGIEIQVKFREKSRFETLSAHRQSGGERSVSTIMYLMALQDLMVSPFRCVDEINQGLDERNERLVFRRIVMNSTDRPQRNEEGTVDLTAHSGQYFLITPKLLPNLTDMEEEAVTCHIVTNGPFTLDNPRDWDPDSFIREYKNKKRGRNSNDTDKEEESPAASRNGSRSGKRRRVRA